ncbi:hypothetical protein M432DRAFT_663857 [Thermoascus aurantiacus ATCC 26904]
MELTDVKPSEVTFQERLCRSPHANVFLVTIRGVTCVMKASARWIGFTNEVRAYRRLKKYGICDRGLVPNFYGTIEQLDPELYEPHLDSFRLDVNLPSAVLLEYIPGMERLWMDNHTRERMDGFIEIAREIHKAHVLIEDIHWRNMMVFPDHPTRVLWLDFDVSRTYDEGQLTDKQKRLFEEEMGFVIELGEDMEADIAEGRVNRLAIYT